MMEGSTKNPELAEVRTVGLQLCTKLRELGSRVASVQAVATKLAESVQCHWRVIDSLTQRLRSSESVHHERATALVQAIITSTLEVFQLIGAFVPTKSPDSFAYSLHVKQKMKSMRKKTPIETLVQRIEFLRCAAQLLVTTLTIGEKVKWARLFGRGNPSDRVEFETTRVDDKPAKYCLSEAVLETIKTFRKECEAVTTLLPFVPYQPTTKTTPEEEAFLQAEFVADHIEIWWRLLLAEWTNIGDKRAEEAKAKEEKRMRVKKPRVKVIPVISEDVPADNHLPKVPSLTEMAVH